MLLVIESLLLIYFVYVVGYTFLFSLAAFLSTQKAARQAAPPHRIAVLIPAYQEDKVIVDCARHALLQKYPEASFSVVVIADSLQPATLDQLRTLALEVIEVSFENSTKVKALNAALATLPEEYDIAVILDADNLMGAGFLQKVNQTYAKGYKAMQGQRMAKNRNTPLAVLDGLSEHFNNQIYRKGSSSLGLSSGLSGSGMAFDYPVLKKTLSHMDSVGGFDRELEVLLLMQEVKVKYLQDLWVYDEKVSQEQAFKQQRRRWIASQYQYLARYWKVGLKALLWGRFSLFNSALLRNIQLPRLLNIGLLTFATLLSWVFSNELPYGPIYWSALWLILAFSLFIAVPLKYYDKAFFRALLRLPRTFWVMFGLLFRLKGANKKFLHTPHGPDE